MLGEYGIKDILQAVYNKCKGVVSNNVYTTTRPRAVPEKINDFVVVSLGSRISDHGAIGNGYIGVSFYVRFKDSGVENLNKVAQMQSALFSLFPCKVGHYYFGKPAVMITGEDNNGFHIHHFQLKLTIE